jgi:propionyl-CoA carboxylase alpha chain
MPKTLQVKVGERWYTVEVGDVRTSPVRVLVDGEPVEVDIRQDSTDGAAEQTTEDPPAQPEAPSRRPASALKKFTAPMPGVIVSVAVESGDQVVTGDEVCVLEAMKMQQVLRSDWTGIVRAVHVHPGQQVRDGEPIVDLE